MRKISIKILQYILFIPVVVCMIIGVIGVSFLYIGETIGQKIGLL